MNVVVIASKLQKFEWANHFIKTYSNKLPNYIQKDLIAITSSFLCFFQESYEQVIQYLSGFKFHTFEHHINANTLLIRSYYKLQKSNISYYDPLFASCKAFENYIRRSTVISDVKRESYLNFISFIKKITQNKYKNTIAKNALINTLNSYTHVFAKTWLEEEIELT